jgi:pyruvate,orthophosphate dikinase
MAQQKRPRASAKSKKKTVRKSARRKTKPASGQAKGKWVYSFGDGRAEGKASMRNLLGGKGAGLAEMANLGLPVPPGFTITTDVCTYYYANDKQFPAILRGQQNLRRQVQPAISLGAVGRACLNAGHDGYRAQPRSQ